ncbi:squalene/phytoene synthase family protein [Candidatus Saccharibacteria bacterium]|nr:squalene/phytoene synthase family protein [Candidatus Saccharibacteria bacterium]
MNNSELYTKTSQQINKLITQQYSTSFSTAMRLLDEPDRTHLYNIYGFVRVADELVDTLRPNNSAILLKDFEADTFETIRSQISLNPVIHAFAITVNTCNISLDLIKAFFVSMHMDLSKKKYSDSQYQAYIYGSAEAVGLMCLCVFTEGKISSYKKYTPAAQALGSAFQKVNFLRDLRADNSDLGRVYFPGVDFAHFNDKQKNTIIQDISSDFKQAKIMIHQLPIASRYGVLLAYLYYMALLHKLTKTATNRLKQDRIRVLSPHKLALYILVVIRKFFRI